MRNETYKWEFPLESVSRWKDIKTRGAYYSRFCSRSWRPRGPRRFQHVSQLLHGP